MKTSLNVQPDTASSLDALSSLSDVGLLEHGKEVPASSWLSEGSLEIRCEIKASTQVLGVGEILRDLRFKNGIVLRIDTFYCFISFI